MRRSWRMLSTIALACAALAALLIAGRAWADPVPGDAYEPDDGCEQARPISITGAAQGHTFHQYGDTDWASFTAEAERTYWIEATGRTRPYITALTLFTACPPISATALGPTTTLLRWTPPSTVTCFVEVTAPLPEMYGPDMAYDLSVVQEGCRHYVPFVGHNASAPTFTLPSNLPAVEAVHPLTGTARDRLQDQGFVILNVSEGESLSDAYMGIGGGQDLPVFVTSDATLYLFHAVVDDLLKTVEKGALYTETQTLVEALQGDSADVYASMPVTQPLGQEAARHNLVVFSVARRLLEPDFVPPPSVLADVLTYTRKISEHTAVENYPGDDYTQYEPRGHYAGDAQLERYFRAMKWLGRRIYRIQDTACPHDADVELVAAVELAHMLERNASAQVAWQRLYGVTRQLVGPADSITPPLVTTAVSRTFGISFSLALLEEPDNLALLRDELLTGDEYPTSEIIPVPTLPGQMPSRYVQVMGERYLPDGEVMQETVYPHTAHTIPSGLDVMATVLASDRAGALLAGETAQDPAYAAQLANLRAQFATYTTTWWTRSTYNHWLHSLKPLVVAFDARHPRFMQSAGWERKELNTALASWSHLRHDFILYTKQSVPPFGPSEGPGFVEPVPACYTRLSAACHQISGTLSTYGMLPPGHARVLGELAQKLDRFAGYAEKMLAGQPLDAAEQGDINRFGLWQLSLLGGDVWPKTPVVVADVASDPNTGRVLHEGVGTFNPIVVIYEPPGGERVAGVGYVMSHYEFTRPNWERMTDAEWRTQVISGTPPARAWWMADLLDSSEGR